MIVNEISLVIQNIIWDPKNLKRQNNKEKRKDNRKGHWSVNGILS